MGNGYLEFVLGKIGGVGGEYSSYGCFRKGWVNLFFLDLEEKFIVLMFLVLNIKLGKKFYLFK